jgi:hypothetical protein
MRYRWRILDRMSNKVDVLLGKATDSLSQIDRMYERDLAAAEVSAELLYAVRSVVQDTLSALDWTASAVSRVVHPGLDKRPYFTLVKDPAAFEKALDNQISGIRTTHPAIADAFLRQQPFQAGNEPLGYLHDLARVNKHQDFTAQKKIETPRTTISHPAGASISWSGNAGYRSTGNAGIFIGGVRLPPSSDQLPSPDSGLTVIRELLVDWRFVAPNVSVKGTLHAIVRLVKIAVHDVRSSAGL